MGQDPQNPQDLHPQDIFRRTGAIVDLTREA